MAFDLADRGIYGFSTSETLRFADVDANGHVNNGSFIERQMFYPGTATACARVIEVHDRKCVIGQGLFDGDGNCTAVQKVIMVSLNEETHRSTPFDPVVRAMIDRLAASKDGLTA